MGDAGAVEPVQHTKHAQYLTIRAHKRHCQQLPHVELRNPIQIGAGYLAGIVGPKQFFVDQRAAGYALREYQFHSLGLAVFSGPADVESACFQQANKRAAEP